MKMLRARSKVCVPENARSSALRHRRDLPVAVQKGEREAFAEDIKRRHGPNLHVKR